MWITQTRQSKTLLLICHFLIWSLLLQLMFPVPALALTGGPSQPEVQSFEPIGTSEMVDPFSGNFSYNIPLLDVGGYPINLSYNAGASSMDAEASWVGLGWNINPGVINRNMRGLPDDFKGDRVTKESNMKPNSTYGVSLSPGAELVGFDVLEQLEFSLGMSYNNYTGVGFNVSANPTISAGIGNKPGLSLGLGLGSESGLSVSPELSYDYKRGEAEKTNTGSTTEFSSVSIGATFNTRGGIKALNLGSSKGTETNYTDTEKKSRRSKSQNGKSSISFTAQTYTPQLRLSLLNTGLSFSGTLGGEVIGAHPKANFKAYFSSQYLSKKTSRAPAYGYLYTHEGTDGEGERKDNSALLDFNREKDGSFTKFTPVLPVTNFTYDVYSVSGQGIGGMYRPHRSDIGILKDQQTNNFGGNLDFPGLEIGFGGLVRGGLNVGVVYNEASSGKWKKHNSLKNAIKFRGFDIDNPLYEPFYFKQAGEKTPEKDQAFFEKIGGYDPVKIALKKNLVNVHALAAFERNDNSTIPLDVNTTKRAIRDIRNELVSTLTAKEASEFGISKTLEIYPENNFTLANSGIYENRYEPTPKSRADGTRLPHHISEITALRSDGARYIYGLPAYNLTQEEVTFAVDPGDEDCSTGLVSYTASEDNTKKNKKGLDHYFDKTVLPAYAHSYLLTAIVSSDYEDVTGDGLTTDDIGGYTKINYSRAADETTPYQWRTPFQEDKANFSEGFKHKGNDNKASYIYGKKEIYYVHSIETKTHVAEFTLEDREDSYGVLGENGGLDNSVGLKKLRKISLYSLQDKIHNTDPVAIKEVHFEYKDEHGNEYFLCKGAPNSQAQTKGKLTLTKVYFTYGNSYKGQLSPYTFSYGQLFDAAGNPTSVVNPDYNLKGYDRWGNYMENKASAACDDLNSPLSTAEFPYTSQKKIDSNHPNYDATVDRSEADVYAAAWNLSTISLPSGGEIKVNYEADDYAYVQDKQAMQMFKVAGTSKNLASSVSSFTSSLFDGITGAYKPFNYIYFPLEEPLSVAEADRYIKQHYLKEQNGKDIDYLYFKFLVNLARGSANAHEYVPGYCKIDEVGAVPFSNSTTGKVEYGFVKVKANPIDDKIRVPGDKAQPIAQAAWNYTQINLPRLASGLADADDPEILQVFSALANMMKEGSKLLTGINDEMRKEGMAKTYEPDKSWIRLYTPDQNKKGGGSRVHKILMTDAWKAISDEPTNETSNYGQVYDYTTINPRGEKISSGVASWEPIIGGDENPFRSPIFVEEKRFLAPNKRYFMEKPIGESFYPGASVGYSTVTIRNLPRQDVTVNATGRVVNTFYTAKDFPTVSKHTDLVPIRKRQNPVFKLLKVNNFDYMTATQGHVIELNDMHGKPKRNSVYQEDKRFPISYVEYRYKTKQTPINDPYANNDLSNLTTTVLDNEVVTINPQGQPLKQTIGVDYDFVVDMRQSKTSSIGGTLNGNLDAFLLGLLPITLPIILPSITEERTRFRSATTTKVINRYGILDEVIASDLGSVVSTKNLAWDAETGEVLVTETVNEHDDDVFSFTYPGHWAYDKGIGQAYKNQGMEFEFNPNTSAGFQLVPGDYVLVDDGSNAQEAWITDMSNGIRAQDRNGNTINLYNTKVKVLRSGRTNMASTPIASVLSKMNPLEDLDNDGAFDRIAFNKVLDAQAVELEENWNVFCNCNIIADSSKYNPYVLGLKGNWKPKKSYLHLTSRTQHRKNENLNIRKDGTFTDFNPFWELRTDPNNTSLKYWTQAINKDDHWTYTSEISIVSPYGFELENKDALGRYSSATYGYSNTLPLAVSGNAQYKEIGFDGFEDYDYEDCKDDHFSYETQINPNGNNISEDESHTGRRSLKVPAGQSITLTKQLK